MNEIRKVKLPNEELFENIKELVAEGHQVTFRVKGNSMNPFLIDCRDEVIISPFDRNVIKPGCLILAKDEVGKVILHRVIRVKRDEIVMMGDGNCYGEEKTGFDKVAGVITGVVRNGRYISCQSWGWKAFSAFWKLVRPYRHLMLAFWRRILRKI